VSDVDLVAFADWVSERAEKEAPRAAPDPERLFVAFRLQDEEYGFPVANVREILRLGEVSRVPQAPPHIRGVMNVRGKVLPIVEIRTRIGLPKLIPTPDARVVVLEVRERSLGLLVDRVTRVARVLQSSIEPPPSEVVSARTDYVSAVAKDKEGLLILLDPEKTLLVKG
jgi:purine-binding chemotaxis protein CheW